MKAALARRAAALVVCLGARAAAAVCDGGTAPDPGAPARVGPDPAGFGTPPEACAGSEIALQGGSALLVAEDDFYGNVAIDVSLRGRYAVTRRLWLSLEAPGVSYRYVANATVTAGQIDLGAADAGVHYTLPLGPRAMLAPYLRVLIPTETVYVNGTRYGVDHGLSAVWQARPGLDLLGALVFPASFTDTAGHVQASFQPGLGAELAYAPATWFTLVGGAVARLRLGDDDAFESFEPTLALRFFPVRSARIELAGRAPLFGADRTDAGAALNVAWLFGATRRGKN